jgi:signal transduction histidine kinase
VQALAVQLGSVAAVFTTDGSPHSLRAVHGLPEPEHASFARFAAELFTREARDPEWAAHQGFPCVTLHPLVGGGQTIGFLVLMATTRLTDDVLATVRAVADTLAGGLVYARTEEAKAQLLAQLERANRVKSEFVSTMSHELRTPLNVIMGYADMLGDPGCPDPAFALGRIRQANHELLELIEATLDLNRLEAGRDEPTYNDVSFDDLWHELAAEFAPAAARAGLRLDWTAEPALAVRTDRRKLRTIVTNLVGNAPSSPLRAASACSRSGTTVIAWFGSRTAGSGSPPTPSRTSSTCSGRSTARIAGPMAASASACTSSSA